MTLTDLNKATFEWYKGRCERSIFYCFISYLLSRRRDNHVGIQLECVGLNETLAGNNSRVRYLSGNFGHL